MNSEIRAAALRLYLLFDVYQQLQSSPNRGPERAVVEREARLLIEKIQTLGATIEDIPPRQWFQSPRSVVVLQSGGPIAPEHSRVDVERELSTLVS